MKKHFFNDNNIDLHEFKQICSQNLTLEHARETYVHAEEVISNVLIYDGDRLRSEQAKIKENNQLLNELHHALLCGPGVLVIKKFFQKLSVIDRNTEIFNEIIAEEDELRKQQGKGEGDHFAKGGNNKRIWNVLQKVGVRDSEAFVSYYSNPLFKLISEAWLGTGYEMTAQVNLVGPGGKAQMPHRDYHLGFQSNKVVATYPESLQVASQLLTLQGAVAHCDMSVESGTTCLLPFSQQYSLGYLAYRDQGFIDYFQKNKVQLPLDKGDAIFFSPALFHGAGDNTTKHLRLANLVQISSALAKPTESVNHKKMMFSLYTYLLKQWEAKTISDLELTTAIDCIADGYAFPTNLDNTQPEDGLSPPTLRAIMKDRIVEGCDQSAFEQAVEDYQKNRLG